MSDGSAFQLSDVPGLGAGRLAALARAGVEDVSALRQMPAEELTALPGIGVWQARRIARFLSEHPDGTVAEPITPPVSPPTTNAARPRRTDAYRRARQARKSAASQTETAPRPAPPVLAAPSVDAPPELGALPGAEQIQAKALDLAQAIRDAAVTRRLSRQLTRLILVAQEVEEQEAEWSLENRREARDCLDQAQALMAAWQAGGSFRRREQQKLARRLRRRRRALQQLLTRE